MPYEEVTLSTDDGESLSAWWIAGNGPLIVFFHGNGGNISHRIEKLRAFHLQGASVFIFDYRGYGKSTGSPTEQGLYIDGAAATAWAQAKAKSLGVPLIYYGESLGTAVAVEAALKIAPNKLVLDSPFTSTVAMAKVFFPFLPGRLIIRDRFDSLSKIGQIRVPLVVLHSPDDEMIPYRMGKDLFDASRSDEKVFIETSGGHNDGFLSSESWEKALSELLKEKA